MSAGYFAQHETEESAQNITGEQPAVQHLSSLPRCANCDIEIAWSPTICDGLTYCCVGCTQGGPCSCDYADHV